MKQRKWLLWIVALLFLVAAAFIAYMGSTGFGMTAGYLYIGEEGTFLVKENDLSMRLSDQSATGNVFQGLRNGDKVLVLHDSVEETLPARTGAYHIFRIAKGDENYRPADEVLGIEQVLLSDDPAVYSDDILDKTEEISKSNDYGNISVQLPENWEFTISEDSDREFSIYIWPEDQAEGKIRLMYTEMFAVCGTGLEQKEILFGEYEAWQGTYDNAKLWDSISIRGTVGSYVILNEGTEAWWDEYGDEAMSILGTMKIAQGIATEKNDFCDHLGWIIYNDEQYVQISSVAIEDVKSAEKIGNGEDFEGYYKSVSDEVSAEIYKVENESDLLVVKLSNGAEIILKRVEDI